jgi:cell division protein ZapA
MGKVHIIVNNRGYDVACDDGQEGQVTELGQELARRVDKIAHSVGQIGDARLLLMAALLVSDELVTSRKELLRLAGERSEAEEDKLADSIERLAGRVEAIAAKLEAA